MNQVFLQFARSRVGRTLAGKWLLEELLGIGGMGAVYRATHLRNGLRVAVKILAFHAEETDRRRFMREGYAANLVGHPGVVSVLDDGDDDGHAFLVMELLTGRSLKQLWLDAGQKVVERAPEDGSAALTLAQVHHIVGCVLDALAAAHEKGVVHRDIKPDNIFVELDGCVRLIDFGIARIGERGSDDLTTTESMMGTPAYIAPEQARSAWDEVDGRSDLFSVAATVFRLLTGRSPHAATSAPQMLVAAATVPVEPVRASAPEVPGPIADVLDRALRFDPKDRFASAKQMRLAWTEAGAACALSELSPEELAALSRPSAPRPDAPEATHTKRDQTALVPFTETLRQAPEKLRQLAKEDGPTLVAPLTPIAATRTTSSRWPVLLGALVLAGGGAFLGVRSRAPVPPPVATASHAAAASSETASAESRDPPPAPGLTRLHNRGSCSFRARCDGVRAVSSACAAQHWPLGVDPTEGDATMACGVAPYLVSPSVDHCGLPVKLCDAGNICKEVRVRGVSSGKEWYASPNVLSDFGSTIAEPSDCGAPPAGRADVRVEMGAWDYTFEAAAKIELLPGATVTMTFEPKKVGNHVVELRAEGPPLFAEFCWSSDQYKSWDCWTKDKVEGARVRRHLYSGSTDVKYKVNLRAEGPQTRARYRTFTGP